MQTQNIEEHTVEERLAAVERTVARIVEQLHKREPVAGWLTQFRGCMADEPGFLEFVRYGREFRLSDRPPDDDESPP